jgi:ABC-type phosphate/phosphonate transport system substrate-binding protein
VTAARVANLGMYDFPWLRAANDALWAALAARLRARGLAGVPDRPDRGSSLAEIWRDPGLLLAQTCGYPLVTELAGAVTYVATPRYAAPGCAGTDNRSRVVVRADSRVGSVGALRGARAAVNGLDSNSGMNLLRALVAPLSCGGRFFGEVVVTGAHLASLEAVAEGRADAAAIDCVSLAQVGRGRPELATAVRVLAETPAAPGLPLVTRRDAPPEEVACLRAALAEAAADPALAAVRDELLLLGFEVLPEGAYGRIAELEREAGVAGYPRLA